jgi:hypothetical protein
MIGSLRNFLQAGHSKSLWTDLSVVTRSKNETEDMVDRVGEADILEMTAHLREFAHVICFNLDAFVAELP